MRILIDGLDLTGKTTLAKQLAEALRAEGAAVVHHRGVLAPRNPVAALLERRGISAPQHPTSALLNAAYLVACALDRPLRGAAAWERSGILIQESYVDRSLAYGIANGPWAAARLALRFPHLFTGFDLALYLHAPLEIRRGRLERRKEANVIDHRSVSGEEFQEAFTRALRTAGRRHRDVWFIDTSQAGTDRIVADVVRWARECARPATGDPGPGRLPAPRRTPRRSAVRS
ncbi:MULTISPECIES: nucleoside/nucleotide kinase family protein [Kitasatospora]|uniref:Thymidylate kinase n=1 Tax=Kitasatospora cathayae TaxID=3004092 RepID=A0ABY7QES0_9ACTN|nr:hypothetical protein [Kitasatospora sp. HUAS 3-15]WBP91190.1 hypothetical protein O1G21_38470 [Kitasatospora sp. HUAS 3-15]